MKMSTLRTCACLLLVSAILLSGTADAQRSKSKKTTTEAPVYDDYEEYDQAADDGGEKANDKVSTAGKNSVAPSSTTAAPAEGGDDEPKGTHTFFKNRLRLRTRPSPHPAVKVKPTLPSFIKHPANIEDLGHEHRHQPKPTQPPLPRPKPTTAKPHRFSSGGTLRKKPTPPPARDDTSDDYGDEEEATEKRPAAPAPPRKPLRPRRN